MHKTLPFRLLLEVLGYHCSKSFCHYLDLKVCKVHGIFLDALGTWGPVVMRLLRLLVEDA